MDLLKNVFAKSGSGYSGAGGALGVASSLHPGAEEVEGPEQDQADQEDRNRAVSSRSVDSCWR
ncbi:hypothetical protein ACFQX7_26915 [Luedemannella flava]